MDSDEFRKAVGEVAPLKQPRRADLRSPAPAPVARQRRKDEIQVLEESLGAWSTDDALDNGEELTYLRHGMSRDVLRKLRRGHWVVQAHIDLHGLNRIQAGQAIVPFMRDCIARGLRCVRIVHGKGLGSHNREPVLKAKLRTWLPLREEVLAFCQAPANDGGSGAVLVLLRSKR
jgi:DNA-nicking Smr family endonuclease